MLQARHSSSLKIRRKLDCVGSSGSSEKDCGDLDFCTFDMQHSGAYVLVLLFPEDKVPLLIRYIEDEICGSGSLNQLNLSYLIRFSRKTLKLGFII